MTLFVRAAHFAAEAHKGQRRHGRERIPYINHPLAVAGIVADHSADEDMLAAAVLHDVVEDCDVTLDEIAARFGPVVAGLVEALTDAPDWADLPGGERKARQAEKMAGASDGARLIKMADQLHNVTDLARGTSGRPAAKLAAYADQATLVVDACRAVAPDLGARFDAAVARLRAVASA